MTRPGPRAAAGELLDTTLRDGGYAVAFQFDEAFVADLLRRLDTTPLRRVEIGHGFGLEAERAGLPAGSIGLHRWVELATTALAGTAWGMFAQPRFSRLSTIASLCSGGMSFVRVGVEPSGVAATLPYLHRAVEVCGEVHLNLMKTSDTPPDALPDLLRGLPRALAAVYVVDSYGAMLPADVTRYVEALHRVADRVGFHGHDNLGMAVANSLAALDAGAALVDGTLDGIGRGAGNAALESLAGILAVRGDDRYDYRTLAELAQRARSALDVVEEDRGLQVLGGVLGMHSDLFDLVRRTSDRLGLSVATVMERAVLLAEHEPGRADVEAVAGAAGLAATPDGADHVEAR